jgi:hypothetical protein
MDDLKKYYSKTALEVLKLLDYHTKCLVDKEQSGNPDPEGKQKIEMLGKFRVIVANSARGRKKIAENEKEDREVLLNDRMYDVCPSCETSEQVSIVREELEEESGFRCDILLCPKCKTEFLSAMPNNWPERLIFLDNAIAGLTEAIEEEKKSHEEESDQQELIELLTQCKKLKDAQLAVEESDNKFLESLELLEVTIADVRDYLLMTNLKWTHWEGMEALLN